MKIRGFFALLWAGLLAAVAAFAGQPVAELYDKAEYRIAMRDSVALYTAVYTPKAPGEAPVIIFRTPYGCGPYGAGRFPQGFEKGYLRSYVDRGYIIVMQDVRGRYMSEGDFEHVRPAGSGETDETTDSYDTVDWLVRHIPHNNGRVGFAGCSYPGFYATTYKCIVQHVCYGSEDYPVTCNVAAGHVGYCTLNQRQDTTTANHYHEDTGSHCRIFTQSFYCKVEDTTPHDRCTEAAKCEEHDSYRYCFHTETDAGTSFKYRHSYCCCAGGKHTDQQEDQSQ